MPNQPIGIWRYFGQEVFWSKGILDLIALISNCFSRVSHPTSESSRRRRWPVWLSSRTHATIRGGAHYFSLFSARSLFFTWRSCIYCQLPHSLQLICIRKRIQRGLFSATGRAVFEHRASSTQSIDGSSWEQPECISKQAPARARSPALPNPDRMQPILSNKLSPVRTDMLSDVCVSVITLLVRCAFLLSCFCPPN